MGWSHGVAWNTRPHNKGMKQTKPAQAMELRSLSPVFDKLNGSTGGCQGRTKVHKIKLERNGPHPGGKCANNLLPTETDKARERTRGLRQRTSK